MTGRPQIDFSRLVRVFVSFSLFVSCSAVQAQWLDHIDVVPHQDTADIVITFSDKIQYKSHAPFDEGQLVRIAFRPGEGQILERDFIEETLRGPKVERVPRVTVVFAHIEYAVVVTFPQATKYTVRPGNNGRSVVITVPLLPAPASAIRPIVPALPAQPPTAPPPAPVPEVVRVPAPAAPKPDTAPVVPLPPPAAETPRLPPVAATTPETPQPVAAPPMAKTAESVPPPAAPVRTPAETERLAKAFMDEARQAMEKKDFPTVINRCYRILGLEPNSQTEPAQAWIGEVREANGELAKARAEYELYLKLFPNGPNVARVREKLAALPTAKVAERAAKPRELPKEAGPAEWTYFGNVSAYYYTGKSQIETLVTPLPGQLPGTQVALSAVDQDSLITSINLNARRRDAFSDTRIVVRDTDNRNFLTPRRSYNRLYSAYVERNDRHAGYYFRVGRQNPNGIGVLERFDGAQAGYNLTPDWRVNGVWGEAVEFLSPFKKTFYGASVDLLPQAGKPGASVYAVSQTLDGYLNRRAVGAEVRYFDGHATAYGLVDYDVLYEGVNIALLQGNYLTDGGANYFFTIDHRRAPSFSLTNALVAAPNVSLQDLVATEGLEAVRRQAKSLTAISDLFSIGMTYPLTQRWQLGADYQLSRVSSTQPVSATIPLGVIGTCIGVIDPVNNTCIIDTAAQQGSGNTHAVTLQAIGNSLFAENAVGVGSVTFISAPTYKGQSILINYILPFSERWRLDTNLRYYTQKDNSGGTQDRISPSFKLSYQWHNSWYLEAEIGEEISKSFTATVNDHVKRQYFYMGVRWEFR